MTNITVYKTEGRFIGFQFKGHADSETTAGDVVCNGISALSLTTVLSLVKIASISMDEMNLSQEDGFLSFFIPNIYTENQEVNILLENLYIGLEAINENYPEYIQIEIKEGNDVLF